MLIDCRTDVLVPIQFRDPATFSPEDADELPTFRLLSGDGPVPSANGTVSFLEGKDISAITTGAITTIISANHGLSDGAVITITGAAGTTGVNGTHQIQVNDANTLLFLTPSTSGTYTSGASWRTPGLYVATLDATIRAAMEVGRNYTLLAAGLFTTVPRVETQGLTVVA